MPLRRERSEFALAVRARDAVVSRGLGRRRQRGDVDARLLRLGQFAIVLHGASKVGGVVLPLMILGQAVAALLLLLSLLLLP